MTILTTGELKLPINYATGFAIQRIPVPVPSQDKLGGLRQEGHLA